MQSAVVADDEEQTVIINHSGKVEDIPLTFLLHGDDFVIDYCPTDGIRLEDNPIFHLTADHEQWCKLHIRDGYKILLLRTQMGRGEGAPPFLSSLTYPNGIKFDINGKTSYLHPREDADWFKDRGCIQFNSDRDFIIYKLYWQ